MSSPFLIEQFVDSINDGRRIYIDRSIESLLAQPNLNGDDAKETIDRIERSYSRLLIKIFVTLAWDDLVWSPGETAIAETLITEIFQQKPKEKDLKRHVEQLVEIAHGDSWQDLFKVFTQFEDLLDYRPELESALMRAANIVAKVDGNVTEQALGNLKNLQWQIHQFLEPVPPTPVAAVTKQQQIPDQFDPNSILKTAIENINARNSQQTATANDATTSQPEPPAPTAEKQNESPDPKESLEDVLSELDALVGIDSVKQEVRGLVNFLKVQQHRKDAGLPKNTIGLHMVFEGNPGTGKTTVARLLGRVFSAIGLLEKGHLVETDRSGLVAEFAGQTAVKTNKLIDQAIGGVLFIDEAYSLVSEDGKDAYGPEAIQVLLKRAEDDRKRLIVILAGYCEPMQRMLKSNPGLSSRFNRRFDFADYETKQLVDIFKLMCDASHYVVSPEVESKLTKEIDAVVQTKDDHFGNGRMVRNAFEKAMRRLADRVVNETEVTAELLTTFEISDVEFR